MQLPERVVRAITRYFPDGENWVENFPDFFQGLLERWQLEVEGEANPGWPTNQVYFVKHASGQRLILKVGHPSPEAETERLTLAACLNNSNSNVVKLVDSAEGYALLMERIEPGTKLRQQIREPDAIRSALVLHLAFPQPPDIVVPTYSNWLEKAFAEYRRGPQPDPEFLGFIEIAERLFDSIDTKDQYLLHGDLHHENILLGERGWTVIDPKGVIGPRAMELGRLFHNFVRDEIDGEATPEKITSVLQARFELGEEVTPYTAKRLAEITFIDLTLAITWHLNSDGDGEEGLAVLRALFLML